MTVHKIVEDRFTGSTKWVFDKLKRMTKYDQYERRDGSIVSKALTAEDRVLTGV